MNTKNSIKILNIINIIFLLSGFVYISLGDYYMGFDRDLIYRESILEEEYLMYLNYAYLSAFWIFVSGFICREIFRKFSLHLGFSLFVFCSLSIVSILYQYDNFVSTMFFVVFNIFGLVKLTLFLFQKN